MTQIIYRRRYICPHCKHAGRTTCNVRDQQIHTCAFCGKKLLLDEQGKEPYNRPNLPADCLSYSI